MGKAKKSRKRRKNRKGKKSAKGRKTSRKSKRKTRKSKKSKNPVIALAQIRYFDRSRTNNAEKIKKYIRLAKRAGADIICFPESCLHKTNVLNFGDKIISELREECRKKSIWCIVTQDMTIRNKPYNAAILINREGEIAGYYKKIHLSQEKLRSGDRVRVFKTDFGKIGIAICWDLAFSELFSEMKELGAKIVFCPAQWHYEENVYNRWHKKKEKELLKSLISARAFENLFYVALCNPLTSRKDLVSYSAIAGPHKILAELTDEEGLVVSRIKLGEIKKMHKIYDSY